MWRTCFAYPRPNQSAERKRRVPNQSLERKRRVPNQSLERKRQVRQMTPRWRLPFG